MNTRQQYIDLISESMQTLCKGTHLFPSVMIAQGCLESADGNSELAAKYFNHFGMKPGSTWKGTTINFPTKEFEGGKEITINAFFRSYPNLSTGLADHIDMLLRVSVYRNNGVFTATTPELQASALLKAGYATDPQYANKLIAIITANDLKQYDTELSV